MRPETWQVNSHQRVIAEIEGRFVVTNLMDAEIFQFLENMRRNRVNADYQLRSTIRRSDVEDMLQMIDTYLNECKRLLEVIS